MEEKIKEFKSPVAALLWSFTLPGFGQIYNEQYFLGIIFMLWELGINTISQLNLSIMESFHGDFTNLLSFCLGFFDVASL
jgi:TM2 domain-containing membrane protein YozV